MIVVLRAGAPEADVERVKEVIEGQGLRTRLVVGEVKTIVCVLGVSDRDSLVRLIEPLPGVEQILTVLHPFKLASRELHREDTVVTVGGRRIGAGELAVIAGPCAVESEEMLLEVAEAVREAGAHFLRGAIFKPRTSPYSFQGLKERGLEILARVRERTGLAIVTEVTSVVDVPMAAQYVDVIQVGARNMQNYPLLETVGRFSRPVLLKRGMMASIEEWLMSAEYILDAGNPAVILCERGIRTFETYTRNTLDLSAVPVVKRLSHLPIIVDPSHAAGDRHYVTALAKAAVACGADGLMVEVHPDPSRALSDGKQSLDLEGFRRLMAEVTMLSKVLRTSV
ncbi:MAG: 3-deoxy-7-phosphoheptulonate synthase [Anaerolineae bacterium]|nr:3-deoxy-7-phosphoheptulonate synthase [Anaerolineae bacterium]